MALTTTITKKSVVSSMEGMYQLTFNMVYVDGATVLIDRDFSAPYKTGNPWNSVTIPIREQMKKAIRLYKEEQVIFKGAGIDGIVTNLNSTVGV